MACSLHSQLRRPFFSRYTLAIKRSFFDKKDGKTSGKSDKSTVDKEEVELHEKLSENWWDADRGPVKPLHAMNAVRVPFIKNGLVNAGQLNDKVACSKPDYLKGISIADVGCGGGILSLALARLGADVTGIEPGKGLVEVAKAAAAQENLSERATFLSTSIEEHAAKNKNKYDALVASEVIEHISNKEPFVQACVECIKPGGSIFFTTINRTPIAWLFAIFAAEQIVQVIPKGTHTYDKLITPEELTAILQQSNCCTRMVSGYMYEPLTNHFFWQPTTAILYSLHAVKNQVA